MTKFDIFEAGYVVRIRRHADAHVSRRLFYFNHFDLRPRRCKVAGSWRPRRSTVRVSVPRSCLTHHRANRLYLRAWMERGSRSDRAPAVRNLARG